MQSHKSYSPIIKPKPTPKKLTPYTRKKLAETQSAAASSSTSSPLRSRSDLTIASYGSAPSFFQGKRYELITHKLNLLHSTQCISKGSRTVDRSGDSREFILLDFSSTKLQTYFDAFLNSLQQQEVSSQALTPELEEERPLYENSISKTALEIIPNLLDFVNSQMHKPGNDMLIAQLKDNNCVALEDFIENKFGVCRHKTLFTAYLLAKFIKHQTPEISQTVDGIYQIRGYLEHTISGKKSPHAAIVYLQGDKKYFLDANFTDENAKPAFFEFADKNGELFEMGKKYYKDYVFTTFWEFLNESFPTLKQLSTTPSLAK